MALFGALRRLACSSSELSAAAAPASRAVHTLNSFRTAKFAQNSFDADAEQPALSGVVPIHGPLTAAWGPTPPPQTISTSVGGHPVVVHNENGSKRVVVTKDLPGTRWLDVLTAANCRVEICAHEDFILSQTTIKTLMSEGMRQCHGVIGQLTEDWSEELFAELHNAGGSVYSNYAVGYNNVDVKAATRHGIAVGNTPGVLIEKTAELAVLLTFAAAWRIVEGGRFMRKGRSGVLTETTAELAVSLTFAAARRIVEGDRYMRKGQYLGWAPTLMVGQLLQNKTVGIVGAGRIGTAYARMMAEGHKCNIIYHDPYQNKFLEDYISDYSKFLESKGEPGITCTKVDTVEELLQTADVVSLHCNLSEDTFHLLNEDRLNMMKKDATLINCARGPVIDEVALTNFLQANENFRCGLDVYEDEPNMTPGLDHCENVVIVPHIASASLWTRSGMATLAAANVAARLRNKPVWNKPDILSFVEGPLENVPAASPSIVNAEQLGLSIMS